MNGRLSSFGALGMEEYASRPLPQAFYHGWRFQHLENKNRGRIFGLGQEMKRKSHIEQYLEGLMDCFLDERKVTALR